MVFDLLVFILCFLQGDEEVPSDGVRGEVDALQTFLI